MMRLLNHVENTFLKKKKKNRDKVEIYFIKKKNVSHMLLKKYEFSHVMLRYVIFIDWIGVNFFTPV
jgi:hypothetical protein